MRISITPDGAQVIGALLERYYGAGNPCFTIDDDCKDSCTPEKANTCKQHKALLKLQLDLFKAGETELCEPAPKFAKELHHDRHF